MTDSEINNHDDTNESKSGDMIIPYINNHDNNHDYYEKNYHFIQEIDKLKKFIEIMRSGYVKELDEIKKSNQNLLRIIAMNNLILQPLEEMAAPDIE